MYMGESIKSRFKPSYPEKYMGDANNIICRSSWERVFCNWCDKRENVLRWASEEIAIPYVSPLDGRVHRYYPDFLIEIRDTDGKVKKQLIEIKPSKQTKRPETPKRVTKSFIYEATQYEKNMAKWKAATEFCLDNGIEFRIITENELGIKQHGRGTQKPRRRTRRLPKK